VNEGQIVTVKNGKSALKGKCPVCGTTMMKFLSAKQASAGATG
jgi:ssDNA-binding Zn-finger/Zn-ribbon topoisomerase 1